MKFGYTQIKTPKIVLASATAIALFSFATPAFADEGNHNADSNVDLSSIIQDAMSNLNQEANVSNAGTANVSSGGGTANLDVNTTFNFEQNSAALGGDTLVTADAGALGGNSTANGAGITQTAGSGTGTGGGATGTSGGAGADNGATAEVGSVGASCGDTSSSDCLPSASGGGAAAGSGDSNALSAALAVGGDGTGTGGGNSALNLTKSEAGSGIAIGGHASANGAGQADATNVAVVNAPVIAKAETASGDAFGIGNASYTDIAQAMRLRFNW